MSSVWRLDTLPVSALDGGQQNAEMFEDNRYRQPDSTACTIDVYAFTLGCEDDVALVEPCRT